MKDERLILMRYKWLSRWLCAIVAIFCLTSLSGCIDEEEMVDTPKGNFEALWRIID